MTSNRIKLAIVGALLVASTAGCSVMRGQQSAGAYVDDAGITTKVKSAFAEDSTVAATSISVETLNGTVQLSGFAKSQAEKNRAAEIARKTEGVKSVKNDIVVRPCGRVSLDASAHARRPALRGCSTQQLAGRAGGVYRRSRRDGNALDA